MTQTAWTMKESINTLDLTKMKNFCTFCYSNEKANLGANICKIYIQQRTYI